MTLVNKHTLSGIMLGVIGLLYYANFRQPDIWFDRFSLFSYLQWVEQPIILPRWFDESFPTFLHIIGMSLFTFGVLPKMANAHIKIPVFWFVIDSLLEFMQATSGISVLSAGNFEWVDIWALAVGGLMSWVLLVSSSSKSNLQQNRQSHLIPKLAAVGVGVAMITGSYLDNCTYPNGEVESCKVEPIYISMETIRSHDKIFLNTDSSNTHVQRLIELGAASISGGDKMNNAGRILKYGDYLLVNDRFRGSHVFDNSDPSNPEHLAFIRISGNQDLAIANDVLYLDSFVDIVALDFSLLVSSSVQSTDGLLVRNQGLISHTDVERLLPDEAYFDSSFDDNTSVEDALLGDDNNYDVDEVAIGYETESGVRYYFWDLEL